MDGADAIQHGAAAGRPCSLPEVIGRAPAAAARRAALLLAPPPESRPGGFAAVSAALHVAARRSQAALGPDDALIAAAAAMPEGGRLRAAIACEQRLGALLGELNAMRDEVMAGISAVATG